MGDARVEELAAARRELASRWLGIDGMPRDAVGDQ
jgi:hypothetical protein